MSCNSGIRNEVYDAHEQDSPNLRKAEVSSAAAAGGIPFEEKVYAKVMKELCTSRAGVWSMRRKSDV